MAGDGESALAVDWETSSIIRSRFHRTMPWLQWPYHHEPVDEGEDELANKFPCCTRSLELNVDALIAVLTNYEGNFVEIPALQHEALGLANN